MVIQQRQSLLHLKGWLVAKEEGEEEEKDNRERSAPIWPSANMTEMFEDIIEKQEEASIKCNNVDVEKKAKRYGIFSVVQGKWWGYSPRVGS